jgi:hypothetical protein
MDIIQFSDTTRDQLLYSQSEKDFKEECFKNKHWNPENIDFPTSYKKTLKNLFDLFFSWDRTI